MGTKKNLNSSELITINNIPNEILAEITKYLINKERRSFLNFASTCKRFNRICREAYQNRIAPKFFNVYVMNEEKIHFSRKFSMTPVFRFLNVLVSIEEDKSSVASKAVYFNFCAKNFFFVKFMVRTDFIFFRQKKFNMFIQEVHESFFESLERSRGNRKIVSLSIQETKSFEMLKKSEVVFKNVTSLNLHFYSVQETERSGISNLDLYKFFPELKFLKIAVAVEDIGKDFKLKNEDDLKVLVKIQRNEKDGVREDKEVKVTITLNFDKDFKDVNSAFELARELDIVKYDLVTFRGVLNENTTVFLSKFFERYKVDELAFDVKEIKLTDPVYITSGTTKKISFRSNTNLVNNEVSPKVIFVMPKVQEYSELPDIFKVVTDEKEI
jgi:hypothetical protein